MLPGDAAADPGPEEPLEALVRWERSGAHWRVVGRGAGRLTIGLFTCDGGEEMGRFTSSDDALLAYVGDRDSDEA